MTGMLGNDLGQLLDGIDYGGVEVSSYSFGAGTGWILMLGLQQHMILLIQHLMTKYSK